MRFPAAPFFRQAFPFHLHVDADLVLLQAGSAVDRVCGGMLVGRPLAEAFELEKPAGPPTYSSLLASVDQLLVMRHRGSGLRLRGQLLVETDPHGFFFLVTPQIQSIEEFERQGLQLGDLARHDAAYDNLLLIQAQRLTILDARRMNDSLMRQRSELRASEERFRRAFLDAPLGMGIVAPSGELLRVNPALCAMLGQAEADLLGGDLGASSPAASAAQARAAIARLVADQGSGCTFELEVHPPGRSEPRWAHVTASLIDDALGEPLQVLVLLRDDTEVRHRAAEQAALVEHLTALNKSKDDLISNVSHELRTPLAAMKGAVRALASATEGPVPESYARFGTILTSQFDRLNRMIDDLMDLATMQDGGNRSILKRLDLGEVVADAVEAFAPIALERGLVVRLDRAPAPIQAHVDADRLLQVLNNLMSNAAKFTPRGGTIVVTAWQAGSEARVAVRDSGPGIPPADWERIFEKFVQLDGGPDRRHGGMGLGLAICKAIVVDGHLGRIWAEHAPEGGAAIVFALPQGD